MSEVIGWGLEGPVVKSKSPQRRAPKPAPAEAPPPLEGVSVPRLLTLRAIIAKGACLDGRTRFKKVFGKSRVVDEDWWPRQMQELGFPRSDASWLARNFLDWEDRGTYDEVSDHIFRALKGYGPAWRGDERDRWTRSSFAAFAALYTRPRA
jgi:hypothetical protein